MTFEGETYKVRDLMRPAVILKDDIQLKDALEALVHGKSNIAVVVDSEGRFAGGVSTIDIINAILPKYLSDDKAIANFVDNKMLCEDTKKAASKKLSDFIDHNDVTVHPDMNLLEATLLSVADSLGRLIVVDDANKPVGILTRTEIKQVLAVFLDIDNDFKSLCKDSSC